MALKLIVLFISVILHKPDVVVCTLANQIILTSNRNQMAELEVVPRIFQLGKWHGCQSPLQSATGKNTR